MYKKTYLSFHFITSRPLCQIKQGDQTYQVALTLNCEEVRFIHILTIFSLVLRMSAILDFDTLTGVKIIMEFYTAILDSDTFTGVKIVMES